jgi:hypothetical protein
MYYQILENLLRNHELEIASESELLKLDGFLASLGAGQANQISPWRVSQKLDVKIESIYEVFLKASSKGLLSIKYEVWHPETRIKVTETFDSKVLENEIEDDDGNFFHPEEKDIKISFKLNSVSEDVEKKNSYRSIRSTPITFPNAFSRHF